MGGLPSHHAGNRTRWRSPYVVPLHEFFLKFPSGNRRYTIRLSTPKDTCEYTFFPAAKLPASGGPWWVFMTIMHAVPGNVSKLMKDLSFKEGCVIKPSSMLRAWCLASGGDDAASTRVTCTRTDCSRMQTILSPHMTMYRFTSWELGPVVTEPAIGSLLGSRWLSVHDVDPRAATSSCGTHQSRVHVLKQR